VAEFDCFGQFGRNIFIPKSFFLSPPSKFLGWYRSAFRVTGWVWRKNRPKSTPTHFLTKFSPRRETRPNLGYVGNYRKPTKSKQPPNLVTLATILDEHQWPGIFWTFYNKKKTKRSKIVVLVTKPDKSWEGLTKLGSTRCYFLPKDTHRRFDSVLIWKWRLGFYLSRLGEPSGVTGGVVICFCLRLSPNTAM
jgi:hypothetical protein